MKKIDKILLVDDDRVTNYVNERLILKLRLADEIIIKMNGQEALSYLNEVCGNEEACPSLIFLDLNMPVVNGFDFLKEYRKFHLKKDIVIVILTDSKEADDIIRLKDAGNYHYFHVQKPLTENKLIDIYHKYFRNDDISRQMA
ncbi:MAG: response regulator [Cytophagaceae bacterium]|nr:response regulator [Cytophagaceae bacterium]